MVQRNSFKNFSMSICVDTEKLGEIIHWGKTGLIEAWHYKTPFGLCDTVVDIAFFDKKNISEAFLFAKYGEPSDQALETKNNKPLKKQKSD